MWGKLGQMIPITSQLCRSFRGPAAYGRTGTWCFIEWNEWLMVSTLVTPAHTIMELGARYGTTSCMLAAATNNSGRVVSVDIDARIHPALLANLRPST